MPYIGRGIDRGNYLKLDDISGQFDGNLTTFNLTSGGVPFYPGSAFSILVSVAGVIQEPEVAYQIDSNEIVFGSAPGLGADFFCVAMSQPINLNSVSDGTITTSKIAAQAVTPAKLSTDARGVGIQSVGESIVGSGVTQLNFIGVGNTFLYNASTNTVDISISGGGVGAAGTWGGDTLGIHTNRLVGVNTTGIVGSGTTVGVAHSEGALQVSGNISITEGALITDQNIDTNLFIPSGKNGLVIGTVTVGAGITIDVAQGSTLVVV